MVATVTDVPGHADRQINVAITVNVIGIPGAPGAPTVNTESHTLQVTFGTAAPNGAPVEYYTVYTNGAPHSAAEFVLRGHRAGQRNQLHHGRQGDQHRRRRASQAAPPRLSPTQSPAR